MLGLVTCPKLRCWGLGAQMLGIGVLFFMLNVLDISMDIIHRSLVKFSHDFIKDLNKLEIFLRITFYLVFRVFIIAFDSILWRINNL